MSVINIDIPDHLKKALAAEAQRRGLAQRTILILALETYFGLSGDPSADPATMDEVGLDNGTVDDSK